MGALPVLWDAQVIGHGESLSASLCQALRRRWSKKDARPAQTVSSCEGFPLLDRPAAPNQRDQGRQPK